MDNSEDRWLKLEQLVRRVVREEISQLGKKPKINLVNGRWTGIGTDTLESWSAAYGLVDIQAEINKAAAWCLSNPESAPKSQFGRYLNSWLNREQNKAAIRSIPVGKISTPPNLCAYCLKAAIGALNGYRHCRDHQHEAMDSITPPKMPGITAKAVAGS